MPLKISMLKNIRTIGFVWAIIGLFIVFTSGILLLTGHDGTYWFLPINPENYALTAALLLFPAIILIVSQWLIIRKKYN